MYYSVTDYYDPIGEKTIGSQCPDCKNRGCLELFFYQKRIETPFSKKVSKKVTATLFCHHTQTEVPPVLWSDEIANYFDTEKKKLRLNPAGLKFTKWFYFILAIPILTTVAFLTFNKWQHQQYDNESVNIENVSVGNKVNAMMSLLDNNTVSKSYTTWLLVQKIEGDTIWLQHHEKLSDNNSANFDLSEEYFSGDIIKASLPQVKKRSVTGFDYTKVKFSGYITEIEK